MTRPRPPAQGIVSAARLPVRVLFELRRVTEASLSSRVHNVHEEDDNAAVPGRTPTTTLEEPPAAPAVRLPLDVQERLRQALLQWMQALARTIREEEEAGDEQDHR